jgi:hypothetical protein
LSEGTDVDEFVLSMNITQRHMNAGQRAGSPPRSLTQAQRLPDGEKRLRGRPRGEWRHPVRRPL